MENIINKTVLYDYFSGKSTPLQKKMIETWLADPEQRAQYYQWLHEWEVAHLQTAPDWQAAFARTEARINTPLPLPDTDAEPERRHWLWDQGKTWLVAASLILLLGGWLFADVLRFQTVQTGFGEIKFLTLPDGSTVTLNANSAIRFARFGFGTYLPNWLPFVQPSRTAHLTGEADFRVRHLPDSQNFVVKTPKGLNVTVLGTEFTVMSRARKTQVALRSGKVELTLAQRTSQPPLTMQPGDLVVLEPTGQFARQRIAHPEAVVAWKNHRFTFEQTSLAEIAALLEENYGLVVTIKSSELAARTVSGSFPARNADDILKLMAELLQINYVRDNNRVSFTE